MTLPEGFVPKPNIHWDQIFSKFSYLQKGKVRYSEIKNCCEGILNGRRVYLFDLNYQKRFDHPRGIMISQTVAAFSLENLKGPFSELKSEAWVAENTGDWIFIYKESFIFKDLKDTFQVDVRCKPKELKSFLKETEAIFRKIVPAA